MNIRMLAEQFEILNEEKLAEINVGWSLTNWVLKNQKTMHAINDIATQI